MEERGWDMCSGVQLKLMSLLPVLLMELFESGTHGAVKAQPYQLRRIVLISMLYPGIGTHYFE